MKFTIKFISVLAIAISFNMYAMDKEKKYQEIENGIKAKKQAKADLHDQYAEADKQWKNATTALGLATTNTDRISAKESIGKYAEQRETLLNAMAATRREIEQLDLQLRQLLPSMSSKNNSSPSSLANIPSNTSNKITEIEQAIKTKKQAQSILRTHYDGLNNQWKTASAQLAVAATKTEKDNATQLVNQYAKERTDILNDISKISAEIGKLESQLVQLSPPSPTNNNASQTPTASTSTTNKLMRSLSKLKINVKKE